jgi:hypothetical protein
MIRIIFTILLITLFVIPSQGKYVQTCEVKYQTQDGWSKKYTVDVTFISGSELNTATNSFKYNAFSVYAIIFWSKDEATVIKVKTFLTCGTEVEKSCITNTFGDLKGIDQEDREWNICKDDICL